MKPRILQPQICGNDIKTFTAHLIESGAVNVEKLSTTKNDWTCHKQLPNQNWYKKLRNPLIKLSRRQLHSQNWGKKLRNLLIALSSKQLPNQN
ncbi:hypothetical protein J6590_027833 [Homalodisca vitripennis]|nr:hypothetical protein J6590_027833 [Homalodisca vitripennis]